MIMTPALPKLCMKDLTARARGLFFSTCTVNDEAGSPPARRTTAKDASSIFFFCSVVRASMGEYLNPESGVDGGPAHVLRMTGNDLLDQHHDHPRAGRRLDIDVVPLA